MSSTKIEKPSTVYLIDDIQSCFRALRLLINAEWDLSVCGQMGSSVVAFKEILQAKPELVILDISFGLLSGVELLKDINIHFPSQKVLMLSMHDENLYGRRTQLVGDGATTRQIRRWFAPERENDRDA